MSTDEKRKFLKNVTVLYDSREKKNDHILNQLEDMEIPAVEKKLDYGDYSFVLGDRDFRQSCVVERKANINELYSNITTGRNTFEKEILAGSVLANSFTLFLENCEDEEGLRSYVVPDWAMLMSPQRKVSAIGKVCYATVKSWEQRYGLRVKYVPDPSLSAVKMLELFYNYWHSYHKLIAPLTRRTK